MNVKLVMFRENGDRREFVLNPGKTLIGRKEDCDIRIPLTEVSRHHAEVRVDGDAVLLKDLGSANGTFVNNKRVKETKLAAGNHMIIGPVVFTIQIDGEPADIKPVRTRLKRRRAAGAEGGESAEPVEVELGGSGGASDEFDPISALEALASSADQTAIDPFDEEEL